MTKQAADIPAASDLVEVPQAGFPIVGIGASAGGLAAFEAFFSGMPAEVDPGMAFVLVQHLAPDHKSILTDLIRRYTRMQVFEVEDGMTVKINCAYIIPPNRDMAFLNGTLQLLEPAAPRGQRLPIDFFFRSLAQDQGELAIGIVLSGTGSDGTQGVRAIKGGGGMVMVQNPESTEFDGMPRSAIATGLVDYELPASEMAAQLIAYTAHAFGRPRHPDSIPAPRVENAMKKIFIMLRDQTGHDFSKYKPSTIHRRIERRMAVHQIETVDSYVKYLQQNTAEVEALFRDMLIGVTNFFRDPETFKVLEDQVIPKLFAHKRADSVIRIWSAGCSTGEEAYSLAILLVEYMERTNQSYTVQVFATDIDDMAITTARAGIYPASIAADVTPERLARFFTAVPGGNAFRIHKGIRDMLVFSEQDVNKDPPFSKLDMISCRNLLIYLGADLQKKLIPLFHYALNPDGMLFLGTSEGVGEFTELFTVMDRKAKVYLRRDDVQGAQRIALSRFAPALSALNASLPHGNVKGAFPFKTSLSELTEQTLLKQIAPSSALVNAQGDILYLHGRTGMYLEPAPGESGINNILKMARMGLRQDLASTLHKAMTSKEVQRALNLNVKTNGHYTNVNLTVCPVMTANHVLLDPPLYLVILEDAPEPQHVESAKADEHRGESEVEARIATLQQELRAKDEYVQSIHEELESSTEELKSSNEEMQSVNEELQSTNEELETSKEELQSVNEELATVNTELQTKVLDLSQANNDMNNLLAGTGIGTVFVNHQLRILRFTPAASSIINLIQSDVGRPVDHITSNLVGYENLVAEVRTVLRTLVPKEQDVQTTDGKWYAMRIQPYRTLDNVIEGAVISFLDITEMVHSREALQESERRYHSVVLALSEGILSQGQDGTIITWNPAAERILSLSGDQMRGMKDFDPAWNPVHEDGTPFPLATHPSAEVLRTGVAQANVIMGIHKTGCEVTWISINAVPVFKPNNPQPSAVVMSFSEITERKKIENALRKVDDLRHIASVVRDAFDAIVVQDMEGNIIVWNQGAARMYGWCEQEALQMNARERVPEELREGVMLRLHQLSMAENLHAYRTQRLKKDGTIVEVAIIATALLNETGQVYAISTTERAVG